MTDSPTNGHVPDTDGVRKLDNGSVLVSVGGQRVLMRPPKIGVLRRLAEAEEDLRRAEQESATNIQLDLGQLEQRVRELALARAVKKAKGDKPARVSDATWKLTPAKLEEAQRKVNGESIEITRTWKRTVQAGRLAWFRDAYVASTDPGAPTLPENDDDMDAWCASPDTGRLLIEHWESTPLALAGP